jgi:RimJ/RimL family protein N-acetyltransferase
VADWTTLANPPDAVWLARWNGNPSVFGDPSLPDTYWSNHQRIHQYAGGHDETWGGTTFNIDNDAEDAPLASAAVTLNVYPETGWWWNPAQPGMGFFIERQANNDLFMTSFLYDASGRATWVLSTGPMSGSSYSGPLNTYGNGQTLTGAYKSNTQTGTVGTISIAFADSTHGTLTWPGGAIPIQRFGFTGSGLPATPGAVENGWWWNAAESGRGFALEIQNGSVFIGGFMYDASGNPVWYLATGALTSPMAYSGQWAQYGGGQTLTGPYQANSLVNANVGALSIQFANSANGTLTLPDGRQIPITRFAF